MIVDQLSLVVGDAACPGTQPGHINNVPLPCRHFEVVVPADGVLRVEARWRRSYPDGTVWVIVAGVENPPDGLSCK